jgi:hypothetical protein
MLFPSFISFFTFAGFTARTPHSFKISPTIGKLRINLLPRPTIEASCPFLEEFMLASSPSPKTLWGWTPKRHFSSSGIIC